MKLMIKLEEIYGMVYDKSKIEKLVGKEKAKKMGNYDEYTGGGTPIPKGEKLEDHPEAHRVKQPRDEEGKFTYNAVNNKKLKYGPSRGTTVPPTLRGVKMVGATKRADGMIITDGKRWNVSNLDMTGEELVNAFKEYRGYEEGFGDFEKAEFTSVKGRPTKAQKEEMLKGKGRAGYFEDTTNLSRYDYSEQFTQNISKLRREQENRFYRKKLEGIQQELAKQGKSHSIPEIKQMIESGEISPEMVSDVEIRLLSGSRVRKKQDNPKGDESSLDVTDNGNQTDVKSSDGTEGQNVDNKDGVGGENTTIEEQIPTSENNNVSEGNNENNSSLNNEMEKGIGAEVNDGQKQENDIGGPTGGGDNPSGNADNGEFTQDENTTPENQNQNQNINNDVSSNQKSVDNSSEEVDGSTAEQTPSENTNVVDSKGNKKTTKNETPFSKNDVDFAKNNQSGFYNRYKKEVDGLVDYAKQLGYEGLDKFKLIEKIATGKYDSLKDVENAIVNTYKAKNPGKNPPSYTGPGSESVRGQNTNSTTNNIEGKPNINEEKQYSNRPTLKKEFDEEDRNLANTDVETFIKKHEANINNIEEYIYNTLGWQVDLTDPTLIKEAIGKGIYPSYQAIKDGFIKKYKNKTGKEPVENQFLKRNQKRAKKDSEMMAKALGE